VFNRQLRGQEAENVPRLETRDLEWPLGRRHDPRRIQIREFLLNLVAKTEVAEPLAGQTRNGISHAIIIYRTEI
jgi:hypothetical protein